MHNLIFKLSRIYIPGIILFFYLNIQYTTDGLHELMITKGFKVKLDTEVIKEESQSEFETDSEF